MNIRHTFLMATALALPLAFASIPVSAQQTSAGAAAVEEAEEHRANLRAAEADAAYQRALQLSPNDPNVLAAYASFARQMGDNAQAIRLLGRAQELNANNDDTHSEIQDQLARTYLYEKNYDAASAMRRRHIGLNPRIPINHLSLAFSEIGRGNRDDALRELQVAEQLWGDNLNSYRGAQLALSYAHLGRRQDVMRLFDQIRGMENVTQAALAVTYVALGDYGQALERLEAAVNNPESVFGARPLLTFLSRNQFDDPALDGPEFQELFDRLRPQ